ncbi:MAG: hypothetical protein IT454_20890 [Planctomycetes bacterium]|nr:hypothetical protein [Planctomycetota bacterium]
MTHIEFRTCAKRKLHLIRSDDGDASDCGFAYTLFAALSRQLRSALKRGKVPPPAAMETLKQLCTDRFVDQNGVETRTPQDVRQRALEMVQALRMSGGRATSMRARVLR